MARLSRITTNVSSNSLPVTAIAFDSSHLLQVDDLAHACGAGIEWVVQLVDVGIVAVTPPDAKPTDWRFRSADLQRALEARRLERDFGVELDTAALILDLQREVRHLRAALHARGLSIE